MFALLCQKLCQKSESVCFSSEISGDPSDVTVFTGQYAVFSCTTRGAAGHWRLNETNINDLPSAIRADLDNTTVQSTVFYFLALRITGRVEYNGTRVKCAIGTVKGSKTATLGIQGMHTS